MKRRKKEKEEKPEPMALAA